MSSGAQDRRSIAAIAVGDRVRKDMGDLAGLAASIEKVGLLHPVVITRDNVLVAGERRMRACSSLGMTDIPVHVVDVDDLLSAERDENRVRKDFTPSEAVSIARVIEAKLKEASAARRSAAAQRRWAREKGREVKAGESPGFTPDHHATSAAAVVGMGRKRYEQIKEVVEAAESESEKFGDIVETMDATGNVRAAHNELRRRRDNAPARHPSEYRKRHPRPNEQIENALIQLSAVCAGLSEIDVSKLDPSEHARRSQELKKASQLINSYARKMTNEA